MIKVYNSLSSSAKADYEPEHQLSIVGDSAQPLLIYQSKYSSRIIFGKTSVFKINFSKNTSKKNKGKSVCK